MPSGFLRPALSGIELFVRLTPRASKDEIVGVETAADGREHLAACVRAIPDKGKANAALEKLVGAWLSLPRTSVMISAGAMQRLKTVRIDGDAAELATHVAARVQGLGKGKNSG